MQFQPILRVIFSKFPGGACPQTPLEALKHFQGARKNFLGFVVHQSLFRLDPPLKVDITSVIRDYSLRTCSHEPRTVNYPGVMIAPGQALPRVHMMICCPGASSSSSDHYEFI